MGNSSVRVAQLVLPSVNAVKIPVKSTVKKSSGLNNLLVKPSSAAPKSEQKLKESQGVAQKENDKQVEQSSKPKISYGQVAKEILEKENLPNSRTKVLQKEQEQQNLQKKDSQEQVYSGIQDKSLEKDLRQEEILENGGAKKSQAQELINKGLERKTDFEFIIANRVKVKAAQKENQIIKEERKAEKEGFIAKSISRTNEQENLIRKSEFRDVERESGLNKAEAQDSILRQAALQNDNERQAKRDAGFARAAKDALQRTLTLRNLQQKS